MPSFDRLLSRLRDLGAVLGDWFSDAGFFLRYHLVSEVKVRLTSAIPEAASAVRRAAKSNAVTGATKKTADAASTVASATSAASTTVVSAATAVYERAVELTPKPVKSGYRAATKTEGRTAAALRSVIVFVILMLSVIGVVIGVLAAMVWIVLASAVVCLFSVFAIFTQDEDDEVISESTTVETIVNVSVLGDSHEAIVSIRTASLGGEVRDYSIMRDDLDIIDSREPRADVTRVVVRRVSRNAYGWVMSVREIEHVLIAAYTPLRESDEEKALVDP